MSHSQEHIHFYFGDTKISKQIKILLSSICSSSAHLFLLSITVIPNFLLHDPSSFISPFLAQFFSLLSSLLLSPYHVIPYSISPPANPPLSHQHTEADECVASYWSRWVMDDGWEMSDGVQAKVPIRGQLEGGVSPTGSNGRRLGETAAVATAQPRLFNPNHSRCCVSALLCIFFLHTAPMGHTSMSYLRKALHCTKCVSVDVCL